MPVSSVPLRLAGAAEVVGLALIPVRVFLPIYQLPLLASVGFLLCRRAPRGGFGSAWCEGPSLLCGVPCWCPELFPAAPLRPLERGVSGFLK